MQPREGADLFAPRSASMLQFCQPRAPDLTASLREQPAQASIPPLHLLFGASDQLGVLPQGIHTGIESPHNKLGLLVLPSASCSATLQRSRPRPQQPDLFAPRHASMLYISQPRALHFTSTAPRATSASLGTASAPFFWVLPTSSELCPRADILESGPWIISDQESPFCRFAESSVGPRANLRKEPALSSREILWAMGAGPSGLIASAPGVRAWATPFCPILRKQAALDGIFVSIILSSSSIHTVYMGLSTGDYFFSTTT